MRGTCAVIGMVLLLVLAAHLQREDDRRDEELASPAMAYQGSCGSPAAGLESDGAAAEGLDLDSDADVPALAAVDRAAED